MDRSQLLDARFTILNERKDIENEKSKLTKTKTDPDFQELSSELNSKLEIQQRLVDQLWESHLQMKELKSRYKQKKRDELEGAAGDANALIEFDPVLTSGTRVASILAVVEKLIRCVGKADLLKCRLVSRLWNDEVVRFLVQTPDLLRYDRWGELVRDGLWCSLDSLAKTKMTLRTLRNLHLLLDESEHPQLLFKRVKIAHNILKGFEAPPILILEYEHILAHFGKYIKTLQIEDDKDFSVAGKCFGQNGLCPNVEQLLLDLPVNQDFTHALSSFLRPSVRDMTMSKLKELRFTCNFRIDPTPTPLTNLLTSFNGILDNSPRIQHLHIVARDQWYYRNPSSPNRNTQLFLTALQGKPQITRNLKEFRLEGTILDNLEDLCLIQYGPYLKTINLVEWKHNTEFKTSEAQQKEWFKKFLEKVSPSLESLTFSAPEKGCHINLKDFPCMAKLKELDLNGENGPPQPYAFQFLKNFASLRTLLLLNVGCTFDELFKNCLEEELKSSSSTADGSLNCVPCVLHPCLEYFDLGYDYISSAKTIQNMNVAFPNLSRLQIQPLLFAMKKVEEHQLWFKECFLLISDMKNLKHLSINLGEWGRCKLCMDFSEAFDNLKKTPNLVHLKFLALLNFEADLVASSLPTLIDAPKLCRIELFGSFWNLDSIRKAQMETTFANRNIILSIKINRHLVLRNVKINCQW